MDKFTVTHENDCVTVTSVSDFGTTTTLTMTVAEAIQLTDLIRRAAGLPTQDTPPLSVPDPIIPVIPGVPGAPASVPVGVPYKAEDCNEEAANA